MYTFNSPSKLADEIKAALLSKAATVIEKMKESIIVNKNEAEEVDDVEDEAPGDEEFYFYSEEDYTAATAIASKLGVVFESDDEEMDIMVSESNEDDLFDTFVDELQLADIAFYDESDDESDDSADESIDEAKLLKRIRPAQKRQAKASYRKNKASNKLKGKKFRKSAKGKKLSRKSKKMAKRGKTSTGKRITRKN
jgi:hypothetical protein